jgi:predicted nucleic acid-binding protein
VILVDTSAWVDFFRGRGALATRVDELLLDDDVALCGPIITELRRGLRSPQERRKILPLLEGCHALATPADLWIEAGDLGYFLARRGRAARTLDLLIATHALTHSVPLLTGEPDFRAIRDAGVPLLLVD